MYIEKKIAINLSPLTLSYN